MTGAADETAAPVAWDPDEYIRYDRANDRTVVDRALIDDIAANGRIMWEQDSTRLVAQLGGYFALSQVGRDDLASHLGFVDDDVIKSVNGIDLKDRNDYAAAIVQLRYTEHLTVVVERPGMGTVQVRLMIE